MLIGILDDGACESWNWVNYFWYSIRICCFDALILELEMCLIASSFWQKSLKFSKQSPKHNHHKSNPATQKPSRQSNRHIENPINHINFKQFNSISFESHEFVLMSCHFSNQFWMLLILIHYHAIFIYSRIKWK